LPLPQPRNNRQAFVKHLGTSARIRFIAEVIELLR